MTRNDSVSINIEQQVQNQIAFTKLYGYMRYFYPSTETQGINWGKVAILGSALVNNAANSSELVDLLTQFFSPITPALKVYLNSSPSILNKKELIPEDTTGAKKVFYQHYFVQLDVNSIVDEYNPKDTIFGKLDKYPKAGEFHTYRLNEDISASFPLALYQIDNKTYPPADKDKFNTFIKNMDEFNDIYDITKPAIRFGYIAMAWNILQHFYPYFDVVNTNWNQTLTNALTKSIKDSNEVMFTATLKKILVDLHDGHAYVDGKESEDIYAPNFDWEWLENKLVITKIYDSTLNISIGDVIEEIDGIPAITAIENTEKNITGATTGWMRIKVNSRFYNSSICRVLFGKKNTQVKLKLRDPQKKTKELFLNRTTMLIPGNEIATPISFSEIKKGIVYVNLSVSDMEMIKQNIEKLESARGIIFDLRGYPKGNHEIIQHLIDTNVASAIWCKPFTVFPDRENIQFDLAKRWDLPPIKPRLKAKIVFLTNAKAISYAESIMGIIEAYKLADVIGEPTAGTNGNVSSFTFPNGYTFRFTGMKVLKHNGSQHHGIGIQPTIPVSPTIKGFLTGKDEQLEKAIEVLSK